MLFNHLNTPAKKVGAILIGVFALGLPFSYFLYKKHVIKMVAIQKEQERLRQEEETVRRMAYQEKRHIAIQSVINKMLDMCNFSGENSLTLDEGKELESCGDDLGKARKLIKDNAHLRVVFWGFQNSDTYGRAKKLINYREQCISNNDWNYSNQNQYRE